MMQVVDETQPAGGGNERQLSQLLELAKDREPRAAARDRGQWLPGIATTETAALLLLSLEDQKDGGGRFRLPLASTPPCHP